MKTEEIKDIAVEFVESLGIHYSSLKVEELDDRIWITLIPHENISRYIGYRGQNIAAMQHLITSLLWNKGLGRETFMVFDIDGYKKKNEEKIIKILEEKIHRIDTLGTSQTMPFLGSQERRLVHFTVMKNYKEYETQSFTDEKGKRIVRISKKSVQNELL